MLCPLSTIGEWDESAWWLQRAHVQNWLKMKEILMQAQSSSSVHHDAQCKQQELSVTIALFQKSVAPILLC